MFRAWCLLILLAGNEVAQVNSALQVKQTFTVIATLQAAMMARKLKGASGRRMTEVNVEGLASSAMEVADDASLAPGKWDGPTSDKDCIWKKGKCQPEKYCFKKGWKIIHKSRACHVKPIFLSDDVLANKLGHTSTKLIVKSDLFATKGSGIGWFRYRNFRKAITAMSEASLARNSTEPAPKVKLEELMVAWEGKSDTTSYCAKVKAVCGKDCQEDADSVLKKVSAAKLKIPPEELVMKNLDDGMKKSFILRKMVGKLDMKKLIHGVESQPKTSKEKTATMAAAFPGVDETQIASAVEKSETEKEKTATTCKGTSDAQCMSDGIFQAETGKSLDQVDAELDQADAKVRKAEAALLTLEAKLQLSPQHYQNGTAFALIEQHLQDTEALESSSELRELQEFLDSEELGNWVGWIFVAVIFVFILAFACASGVCFGILGAIIVICTIIGAMELGEEMTKPAPSPPPYYR